MGWLELNRSCFPLTTRNNFISGETGNNSEMDSLLAIASSFYYYIYLIGERLIS